LAKLPPKKSAAPQRTELSNANNAAIKEAYYGQIGWICSNISSLIARA
jgi:hypothetical protein